MKSAEAKDWEREWIDERKEETEETSLKFSNLNSEDLQKFREGKPNPDLQFELSFWGDLAKWLFILEDKKRDLKLFFSDYSQGLPEYMQVHSSDVDMEVLIDTADWPKILATLPYYHTNINVSEFRDIEIKKLTYDEKEKIFVIDSIPLKQEEKGMGDFIWDDWIFRKNQGFFPKQIDPLFSKKIIPKEAIPDFLERYAVPLEKYFFNVKISRTAQKISYHLFFDEKKNFHIDPYLFQPGDLHRENSHIYASWVYLEGKGFFSVTNFSFNGIEKIIPKDLIEKFIEENKNWLNTFEKFRIHLVNIETTIHYRMEKETLIFETEDLSKSSETIDLGNWLYIKGTGFFSKSAPLLSPSLSLLSIKKIAKEEIYPFIQQHREELEHVKGFFSSNSGLTKTGLVISFKEGSSKKGQIVVEPQYIFEKWADECDPKAYGDFIYLKDKGFVEIPETLKLPFPYYEKRLLSIEQLSHFINHELKRLSPQILYLDKQLREPENLTLIAKKVMRKANEWIIEFDYSSSYGEISLQKIYEKFFSLAHYFPTQAGLISLKETRFHWLTRIANVKFTSNQLHLSTLDLIRLSLFEKIIFKESNLPEVKNLSAIIMNFTEGDLLLPLPRLRGLKSTLRPYQKIGVQWLWSLYTYGLSGFLCDEMGLGKTHQAMALLAALLCEKKEEERLKFLIVCPTSVVYHWQELLLKFLPQAAVQIYHGSFRVGKMFKEKNDILLTTYGILRSDKILFMKQKFEIAIFDEMHVAKNQKSQIHATLKQIEAKMKLGLTGTPLENNLLELKALFDIILPGFLPSLGEFKEKYISVTDQNKDFESQKILARLIKPFILRRKKEDVLKDLPAKIEEIAYVDLSEEQRELYKKIALQSKEVCIDRAEGSNFYLHVFALLNKLKQVCDHPALITKNLDHFEQYQSGKWELFLELLEETLASNQKLVVFSQYLAMLTIIETHLQREKIGYATIRGATKDRRGEVKRFQEDPSCKVFVASLQAAGVGIDLTAGSVVIHYDRWWNPAKEDQATDRVHRIGQHRCTNVFKFIAKNTIEEHIHQLIEKKKGLISSVIGLDNPQEMKRLDRAELLELLKKIYDTV